MLKFKRCFMGALFCVLLAATSLFAQEAEQPQGMKVYLIRHAETMGNVTHNYTEENQCTFSPKGLEQVAGIAEKLDGYTFDHILVSPTWRTRQTILPYLKAYQRVGEIWPEFAEGGCDVSGKEPLADAIPWGDPIEIDPENADYLKIRPDGTQWSAAESNGEYLKQFSSGIEKVKEQFGQSGDSVLIVCHSCTGSRLIELFLGLQAKGRFSPTNAAVSLLQQHPDGSFELVQLNDRPFEQKYTWKIAPPDAEAPLQKQLVLSLVPEFITQRTGSGYELLWHAMTLEGFDLGQGEEKFHPDPATSKAIGSLEIPIGELQFGDTVVMDAELRANGRLLQAWQSELIVPSYLDLGGTWLIQAGDETAWADPAAGDEAWQQTTVPGGWEKDALPDYDGTAWYRLHFKVPASFQQQWGDRPLGVVMGSIDDADETFLNGRKIGQLGTFPPNEKTAWNERRLYAVESDDVQAENVLAVRVSDWTGGGGIWRGPVAIGPIDELHRLSITRD